MGFDSLTGQEAVKSRLKSITANVGSCSLLFSGTDGIGKHLFAREAAKAVLCKDRKADGACGVCPSCKYIEAGTHPDFIEVEPTDGRKNIRIADLREVVRDAEVKPQISDYKVIVINADKTSSDCQNLMLKSLEEPSSHLVYILLCSDTSRLLPTILSRVTELNFNSYTDEQLIEILRKNGAVDESDDRLRFISSFSSRIPGKALALLNDADFIEERDYIFDLVMRLPNLKFTDILYDEYQYFEKNNDKIDELLLLLIWTLGDIASAIAVPDPGEIKNSDKKDEIIRFVSENKGVTLVNISNAENAVMEFIKGAKVNVTFEANCCNMLLGIFKELRNEKNS